MSSRIHRLPNGTAIDLSTVLIVETGWTGVGDHVMRVTVERNGAPVITTQRASCLTEVLNHQDELVRAWSDYLDGTGCY